MGNWGADHKLQAIVAEFPSGLKQAMFAAASTRTIKRRTWNGCALNAAGIEIGKDNSVKSFQAAADSFGITLSQAKIFVNAWDLLSGTDETCNLLLREAIENAGLFSEPGDKPPKIIVRKKIYEAKQKELREEFDAIMEANEVPNTELAEQLLVGAFS